MEFHSALAESESLTEACDAVASELRRALGPAPLDLAVVFASAGYGDDLGALPVLLQERVAIKTLVGCTGEAQLHPDSMSARAPAISVLAGRLSGAEAAACSIQAPDLPHADAPPSAWRALLPQTQLPVRGVIVLGEPFHFDVRPLVDGLDFVLPDAPKVGGIASGSRHPHGNALFCGRARLTQGAVLLAIAGDVTATPVVSQGCRPIGRPGKITSARGNRLAGVDELPAKAFVEQQLQQLTAAELPAETDQNPLFLGIASDPFATAPPEAGDFLVRNVLGIDEDANLVVAEKLGIGRTVQLHVRDQDSGLEDLERRLRRAGAHHADAAMVFRCVGRTSADHERFHRVAGDVPMAGSTCNGEIGPVGRQTHVHGYSASCMLLRKGAPS